MTDIPHQFALEATIFADGLVDGIAEASLEFKGPGGALLLDEMVKNGTKSVIESGVLPASDYRFVALASGNTVAQGGIANSSFDFNLSLNQLTSLAVLIDGRQC